MEDSALMEAWKNPEVRSIIPRYRGFLSPILLKSSLIFGMGHLSTLVVALLSPWKSKTNL